MTLGLDLASAIALREFAQAMPIAVDNIVNSTEELVKLYQSVADRVGPHDESLAI